MRLGKNKILITGANGFLGNEIYKFLSKKFDVIGTTKKNKKNFIKLNYPMDNIDKNIFKDVKTVIHLASLDRHQVKKNIKLSSQININFTEDLINKCLLKKVQNFIYFSSVGIYGNNLKNKVHETTKPLPKDLYSKLKYMTEKKIIKKKNIRVIILRLSNIIGRPTSNSKGFSKLFLPEICTSALNDKEIILKSDGKQYKDFLDLNILLKIVYFLIKNSNKLKKNKIFNVSSGKAHQVIAIAKKVKKIIKNQYNEEVKIIKGSSTKEKKYQVENKKLRKFLDINMSYNLDKTILNLIKYLNSNEKRVD